MATTTNYGWTTPNDTDLVKDGAAAIRTLGSSVDTTTKALNPSTTLGDIEYRSSTANTNTRLPIGTTGQILSVVAGVPSWVANDVGDITEVQAGTGISVASGTGPVPVITNTVATAIDAKGDLVVGTGADTFSRLAVGTNTYILTADSAEATGLKWAAPAGGGGKVLQVLQDTQVGIVSSTSTTFATTNLSQAITPSSASSKVLVQITINGLTKTGGNSDTAVDLRLLRGATVLASFGDRCAFTNADGTNVIAAAMTYLDSPATTSATTYSVEFRSKVSGQLVYVNNYSTNGDTTFSSITTSEIGA
jgi:hypothetical protein